MKIKYLATAAFGANWFRSYYRRNPQLNLQRAMESLRAAERLLVEFPYGAERFEDYADVRQKHIQETPFSLVYTIAGDTIWIIDIRDTRGARSATALNAFTKELQDRFGLPKNPEDH